MSLPQSGTNNKSTPAPLSTAGFKISKPGYDANTTAGSNLVFDSSWPSLPIILETTVPNTFVNNPLHPNPPLAIPHGQKFPPFAMAWQYDTTDYASTGVGSPPYGYRFMPSVDRTNIYINVPQNTSTTKVRVIAFNLDLSKDIDYTLAPGDTYELPYDNNYGIKVVKPNKSVTSTDMRDFALHSRCQSPLIQAVKTQKTVATAGNTYIQYTNKNTAPVWVYGYAWGSTSGSAGQNNLPDGTYVSLQYYAQALPLLFTDGFTSYLSYNTSDYGATLVILRDPMFLANKITVQY